MRHVQERAVALKRETDELKALLASNNDLTRQDKEQTEKIEALTREIHARITRAAGADGGNRLLGRVSRESR